MTDVVVIADDGTDDVEEVAEAIADVAETVAEVVADVAETVAEAVTEGAATGQHDPIELEHRLTNIEHEMAELRSRSYEAATHQEVAAVVEEVVQTAAIVAAEVADEIADDEGAADFADVTIVEPDVAETEVKPSWWKKVW